MPNLERIRKALEQGRVPPGGFVLPPPGPPAEGLEKAEQLTPEVGPFGIPVIQLDVAGALLTTERCAMAIRALTAGVIGAAQIVAPTVKAANEFTDAMVAVARVWVPILEKCGWLSRVYPRWRPPQLPKPEPVWRVPVVTWIIVVPRPQPRGPPRSWSP